MGRNIALLLFFSLLLMVPTSEASTVSRSFSKTTANPAENITVSLAVSVTTGDTYYAIDESYPQGWRIPSNWRTSGYCSGCGSEDYSCRASANCTYSRCDAEAGRWCNNSVSGCGSAADNCWTTANYCAMCGAYDYDCRASVTCASGACDTTNDQWCNNGTWQQADYCANCATKDAGCCNMSGSMCQVTCASSRCDSSQNRRCFADLSGNGSTDQPNHVKWSVIPPGGAKDTPAPNVTYTYKANAPSQPATFTWSGQYQFEKMPAEASISGQSQVTVLGDSVPPSAQITAPTSNPTYYTNASSITIGGTASDNVGVAQVNWSNSRGGSGTASGTTSWSAGGIALYEGSNLITVTARDAAGNAGTDFINVTYSKGDVDGSHCINIVDLSIVALDFGRTSGFANPDSDINENGVVDIFDLVYVGKDFNGGC